MIQKRLTLKINFSQSSKWQILVCGAGAAFLGWSLSRRNLVEAGVGSGTSDFRSRSRPKKYRLRNTDKEKQLHIFHEMFKCFRYPSGITNTIKFFFLYCTVPVWYEIDCKLTKQAVNCQSETNYSYILNFLFLNKRIDKLLMSVTLYLSKLLKHLMAMNFLRWLMVARQETLIYFPGSSFSLVLFWDSSTRYTCSSNLNGQINNGTVDAAISIICVRNPPMGIL